MTGIQTQDLLRDRSDQWATLDVLGSIRNRSIFFYPSLLIHFHNHRIGPIENIYSVFILFYLYTNQWLVSLLASGLLSTLIFVVQALVFYFSLFG